MLNHAPIDEEPLHLELLGHHGPGRGRHHGLLLLVVGGDAAAAGDPVGPYLNYVLMSAFGTHINYEIHATSLTSFAFWGPSPSADVI